MLNCAFNATSMEFGIYHSQNLSVNIISPVVIFNILPVKLFSTFCGLGHSYFGTCTVVQLGYCDGGPRSSLELTILFQTTCQNNQMFSQFKFKFVPTK